MPITLTSFPKLSSDLTEQSGYAPIQYSFCFDDEGTRKPLSSESITESFPRGYTSVLRVSDPEGVWYPDNCNLIVTGTFTINNPSVFFGENGLVPKSGTLGIAMEWMDNNSILCGTNPFAELTVLDTTPRSFNVHLEYKPQSLKGILLFRMLFYLKDPGTPEENERHLASIPGTILGALDETKVFLQGNDSIFPIVMKDYKDKPLWWVECGWGNPLSEAFVSDNFCIYINTAHKHASLMGDRKEISQSPLFLEIFASALLILITAVLNDKKYRKQTISGEDIHPGSVSCIVHFLLDTYQLETDPTKTDILAEQLHRMIEEKMVI